MYYTKHGDVRVPEADNMPFERWTAYMWCILIIEDLVKSHYLCTVNGKSFIKNKGL